MVHIELRVRVRYILRLDRLFLLQVVILVIQNSRDLALVSHERARLQQRTLEIGRAIPLRLLHGYNPFVVLKGRPAILLVEGLDLQRELCVYLCIGLLVARHTRFGVGGRSYLILLVIQYFLVNLILLIILLSQGAVASRYRGRFIWLVHFSGRIIIF